MIGDIKNGAPLSQRTLRSGAGDTRQLVDWKGSSGSTKTGGAPGWQGGNRSNTSGIARISNAASRDDPTGDCTTNFRSSSLEDDGARPVPQS